MTTKIRPNFKDRQAFSVQIVFGFCLGLRVVLKSHKLLCIKKLSGNNSAAGHDGFGKNCEENHHRRDLPTLPHWYGPGGRAWALAKKKAPQENISRGALGARQGTSYRRFARRMIASWISIYVPIASANCWKLMPSVRSA